jgi:hypothetical protein
MKGGLSIPSAKEVNMLGRHGIAFLLKRCLALAVFAGLAFFVIAFYETIEASYLDLIDSLMVDPPSPTGSQSPGQGDSPGLDVTELAPCDDTLGWIDEYISSGLMPRCSLAHQDKVDVLYT